MKGATILGVIFMINRVVDVYCISITVTVYTGDILHAGTDASVYMVLRGKRGSTSEHLLNNWWQDNHNRGSVDTYTLSVYDVGTPTSLRIRHDNGGWGAGWYLDDVVIRKSGYSYVFDCYRWLDSDSGLGRTLYPKECLYLPTAPLHGTWQTEPSPYIVHQTAVLQCSAGYVRSTIYDSQARITCRSSGYWSSTSAVCCPEIQNCQSGSQICSNNTCTSCVGNNVLYKLVDNGRKCEQMCSYNSHYCWPGYCTNELTSGCTCAGDFQLVSNTTSTSCQLIQLPSIETCHTTIIGESGKDNATTEHSSSTHCRDLEDIYGNFQPISIRSELFVELSVNVSFIAVPSFIHDSQFGVTDVLVTLTKKDINANAVNSTTNHVLQDNTAGTQVNETFSNTTHTTVPSVGFALLNGERLCIQYETKGGGYLNSQTPTGIISSAICYTKTSASQELCYIFDDVPPQNCIQSGECSTEPLYVPERVTRSTTVPVQFRDWVDPIPFGGDASSASGIKVFHITVHGVEVSSVPLRINTTTVLSETLNSNTSSVTLNIPTDNTQLFCVALRVEDKAGNFRHARRFVLIDNTSFIEIDRSKYIIVYSASVATQYTWQTHHDPICLTWNDFFYNRVYRDKHFLEQIEEDPHGLINGSYDQINGTLPIAGTNHINGIVKFEITWGINHVNKQQVANLTSQAACIDVHPEDGDTYTITVKASDIANNVRSESRTVHIDRSEPGINNARLVSNTIQLSEIKIQLETKDTHSGIRTIKWSLKATNVSPEVSGSVSVQTIGRSECLADDNSCYCPFIGVCEVYHYVLPLRSMVPEWTRVRIRNQTCIVSLNVTNHALLSYTESIEFRIEHTPVEGTELPIGLGLYIGIPAAVVGVCIIGVVLFLMHKRLSKRREDQYPDDSSIYDQIQRDRGCQIYEIESDRSSQIYEIDCDRSSQIYEIESDRSSQIYENSGTGGKPDP